VWKEIRVPLWSESESTGRHDSRRRRGLRYCHTVKQPQRQRQGQRERTPSKTRSIHSEQIGLPEHHRDDGLSHNLNPISRRCETRTRALLYCTSTASGVLQPVIAYSEYHRCASIPPLILAITGLKLKASMTDANALVGFAVILLCFLALRIGRRLSRTLRHPKLPPGPPRHFLRDNRADFPLSYFWKTFQSWHQKYGVFLLHFMCDLGLKRTVVTQGPVVSFYLGPIPVIGERISNLG
jgi:hypothetical protein